MPRSGATASVDPGPDGNVEIQLRPMAAGDLDQVLVIERGFAAPWSREMFLQELRQLEISDSRVAAQGSMVLGYVLWWYVADEIHIVNIAVDPRHRRRGIAKRLLDSAFTCGRGRRMQIATLEVRASNEGAIALYEALDFRMVAIRRGYYADNGEDAIVMLKNL